MASYWPPSNWHSLPTYRGLPQTPEQRPASREGFRAVSSCPMLCVPSSCSPCSQWPFRPQCRAWSLTCPAVAQAPRKVALSPYPPGECCPGSTGGIALHECTSQPLMRKATEGSQLFSSNMTPGPAGKISQNLDCYSNDLRCFKNKNKNKNLLNQLARPVVKHLL